MIADVGFKVHWARKNQLTIPMYGPEAQLQQEMGRTRTGDLLLVKLKSVNSGKVMTVSRRLK